jgi:molybdenum cofactor guanylyltransferase
MPAKLSRDDILGAILAGGRSSRLGGGDKGQLEIGGRSIRTRIEERLAPQAGRIILNTQDRLDIAPGPLRGLHAAIAEAQDAGARWVATVSTDVPFIPGDLVERLSEAGPPAIAASNGQRHFIIGLWPVSLLADLERGLIHEGLRRAQDWARRCGAGVVEWPAQPHDPFFNINTPDDLEEARRIVRESAP